MTVKLHTDDLPIDYNLRTVLVENFKIIEQALNDFDGRLSFFESNSKSAKVPTQTDLTSLKNTLISRIDRISRGTDYDTTYAVVLDILKDKGVIK